MNELDIMIDELEYRKAYFVDVICRPTNYVKSQTEKELEGMTEAGNELGKAVYALGILRCLRDNIDANAEESKRGA